LLYVGGFDARKNLLGLVAALSILRARYAIRRTLVCVGKRPAPQDRSFRRLLHEIDKFGLSRDVRFFDFVANDDLLWLYNAAEALVFPSLYEGFGFPPLEAMACGLPVVAFRRSSIPEVVGDAGVLLDRTDAETLASGIAEVLTNGSLRDDLKARGLRRAREFTWAKTAELTLGVYRRVIEETSMKRDSERTAAVLSDRCAKSGLR
jgi:glycosyltransferase involved in cell wall biosynthesis